MDKRLASDVHALEEGTLTRAQFIRRGVAAGVSVSALGTILAACGGKSAVKTGSTPVAAQATPKPVGGPPSSPTGLLVYGNAEPPSGNYWDPAASFGLADEQVGSLVHDTLLMKDATGKNQPWLATSAERVGDRRMKVQLREGVTFQDGSPLTAKDVKASYDRIGAKGSKLAGQLTVAPLHCEITGPMSLDIITSKPYGPLEDSLASVKILSSSYIDRPSLFKKGSMGTGPYKFVSYQGNSITLEANPNYWGDGPYIKTIRLDYIEDPAARINALLTGDVQILSRVGSDQIDGVKGSKSFYITKIGPVANIEGLSQHNGPLKDLRVRQAMVYAVDRESIAKNIMQGLNPVMHSALPTTSPFYKPLEPAYGYDPEKAKALLKETGPVTLTYATSGLIPHQLEIDQAITQYLQEAGFKIKTTKLEVGAFRSTFTHYDFSLNTNASFTGDPDFFLGFFNPPSSVAALHLDDPKIAPLVQAERETVGDARAAKVDAVAEYLWQSQPKFFLTDEVWYFLVSSKIQNYTRAPLIGEALAAKAWVKA